MSLTLTLTNDSGSQKKWGSITLANLGSAVLEAADYLRLITDSSFLADLAAGDATLDNGTNDLPPSAAIRTLAKVIDTKDSGTLRTESVNEIDFGPGLTAVDDGHGKTTVTANSQVGGLKSSFKLKAAFSGNPKKASVTFSQDFASSDYAVAMTSTVSGSSPGSYIPSVEAKTASGFTINMNTNNITDIARVDWIAMLYTE